MKRYLLLFSLLGTAPCFGSKPPKTKKVKVVALPAQEHLFMLHEDQAIVVRGGEETVQVEWRFLPMGVLSQVLLPKVFDKEEYSTILRTIARCRLVSRRWNKALSNERLLALILSKGRPPRFGNGYTWYMGNKEVRRLSSILSN